MPRRRGHRHVRRAQRVEPVQAQDHGQQRERERKRRAPPRSLRQASSGAAGAAIAADAREQAIDELDRHPAEHEPARDVDQPVHLHVHGAEDDAGRVDHHHVAVQRALLAQREQDDRERHRRVHARKAVRAQVARDLRAPAALAAVRIAQHAPHLVHAKYRVERHDQRELQQVRGQRDARHLARIERDQRAHHRNPHHHVEAVDVDPAHQVREPLHAVAPQERAVVAGDRPHRSVGVP